MVIVSDLVEIRWLSLSHFKRPAAEATGTGKVPDICIPVHVYTHHTHMRRHIPTHQFLGNLPIFLSEEIYPLVS